MFFFALILPIAYFPCIRFKEHFHAKFYHTLWYFDFINGLVFSLLVIYFFWKPFLNLFFRTTYSTVARCVYNYALCYINQKDGKMFEQFFLIVAFIGMLTSLAVNTILVFKVLKHSILLLFFLSLWQNSIAGTGVRTQFWARFCHNTISFSVLVFFQFVQNKRDGQRKINRGVATVGIKYFCDVFSVHSTNFYSYSLDYGICDRIFVLFDCFCVVSSWWNCFKKLFDFL